MMRRIDTRIALSLSAGLILAGCSRTTPTPGATSPTPPAPGAPWFEEVAVDRGLLFEHVSGYDGEVHLMPESICGGAALFDMDGDGDLDAYVVQSGTLGADPSTQPGNKLFRNDGSGVFDDVTEGSGTDDRGYGMGVAAGDYDGDGDVDLYVTNLGPNVFLRNDGDGRFTNVSAATGTIDSSWGTSSTFLDYDLDGDLDLYVCNYLHWSREAEITCYNELGTPDYCLPTNYQANARDILYENNGEGTFTDVTADRGLDTFFGTGLGVVAGHFNRNLDLHPDLFVANDAVRDQLWANQRGERFSDVAVLLGCALDETGKAKAGMGVGAQDIDDDGDLDLIVCNLGGESDSFYLNEGNFFTDYSARSGVGSTTRTFTRFGVGLLDFDNDGWLDIYEANGRVMRRSHTFGDDPYAEPNVVLRGAGGPDGPRFAEVLPRGGTAELLAATSRGAAFGDIDGDGGLDVLVVNRDGPAHLLRNIVPDRGHWITLRTTNESGHDVLNAIVSGRLGDRTLTRETRAGSSYLTSSDPRIHLGLGESPEFQDVQVIWPDATIERFGTLAADRVWTLQKGTTRN